MDELKPQESEALQNALKELDAMTKYPHLKKQLSAETLFIAIAAIREISNYRAAPENKALTLEELWQMNHSAIWVKILIPDGILKDGYALIFGDQAVIVDFKEADLCYVQFEEYGHEWLAYARKPEGSAP